MSLATATVAYGWKALLGIALTGDTCYVTGNTNLRVTARDEIQIVMADWERAEATRSNETGWLVTPPIEIRSWVTNAYTNTVTGDTTNWYSSPVTEVVTNTFGWRSDYAMLTNMDAKLRALAPHYGQTVTGLFAAIPIGDRTNQFTQVPSWVGTNGLTNAATYGDWARRVYVLAMQERYEYEYCLTNTRPAVFRPWIEEWYGRGADLTHTGAYNNAVAEYKFRTNGYLSSLQFQQTCLSDSYSNRLYQAGSDLKYETVLSVSTVSNFYDVATTTDYLTVTGDIAPDITGRYDRTNYGGYIYAWGDSNGNGLVSDTITGWCAIAKGLILGTPTYTWDTTNGISSDFLPVDMSPLYLPIGTAHVAWTYSVSTNTYSGPHDPTGLYRHSNTYYPWSPPSNALWEIDGGGWYAIYDAGKYYITQDTNTFSPSWYVTSEFAGSWPSPALLYPDRSGTDVFGVAYGTYVQGSEYHVPRYETNTLGEFNGTADTDTVFFVSTLTKTVSSNDCFSSTNMQHQATYSVFPIMPTAGTNNYYDDQGLGLALTNWGFGGTSDWGWATSSPAAFGGDVTIAPTNTVEPLAVNQSTCTGFLVSNVNAVVDWRFLYATNKFW